MTDIVLEVIRAVIIGVILVYLWLVGRRENIRQQKGWWFILAGFALLFFGMLADLTDNFPGLNTYIIIGDTEYQAFLEKVVGYLFGFLLLVIGFWKWMPTVIALREAQRFLKRARDELDMKVEERTANLKAINKQLRQEIATRKQAEEALRKAHNELELRVEERTVELAASNRQLQKDIAARKQMEKTLEQKITELNSFINNIPDMAWLKDADSRFIVANSAFGKAVGMDPESLTNQTCEVCFGKEVAEKLWEDDQQVMKSRKQVIIEEKIIDSQKNEVWLETIKSPILDESGKATGTVGIARDISSHKQTEDELKQAKESAETSNKAKSEFLANMSHELRTPLNHIIGFTELVVDQHFGELNKIQEEYLNDVLHSSKHLLSLINDILDLSKVEAGKLELELDDVNLRMLLENSLIMIKEKAMKHDVQVSTEFQNIPGIITADERKLKQIFYNLLSNAVKFSPNGGTIRLSATPATRNSQRATGDVIEISVTDTGIGIKREDLARIFNPFEQVENSKSRRFQGTGLGLALTKRLVELHGGRIWAESKGEGKGSTFTCIIPV